MDAALVAFIGGYIFAGWQSGLLNRLVGIGFIFVSFLLSAYFRYPVGAVAGALFPKIPTSYANLVGYTIAFPVVLVGLHVARRVIVGHLSMSGVTREADKGLGAVFGAVEGVLIVSAFVVILDAYFGTSSTLTSTVGLGALRSFTGAFNASETVQLLRGSTVPFVLTVLGPLLPRDLTTLLPGGLPTGIPQLPIPTP